MSTSPQFTNAPNPGVPAVLTAANTALDGTGATGRALIFTAAAAHSLVEKVRAMHKGTNIATVLRVFLNNGSDPDTATNNTLIGEKTIPANTISQIAESVAQEISLLVKVKGGSPASRIYVTLGTAVAAGIHVAPSGGDF